MKLRQPSVDLHGDYAAWAIRHFPLARVNLARAGLSLPAHAAPPAGPIDNVAPSFDVLVECIAKHSGVHPSRAVPALGATHALWLACACILRPGDHVLVESPGYDAMSRIPRRLGAEVRLFERRADAQYDLDSDALRSMITPRTRAVIISNLHNPSGALLTTDRLREIAVMLESFGIGLIVDEVYGNFHSDVESSACAIGGNVVAVGALSKTHGLGGARAGWLCADEDIVSAALSLLRDTLGDPYPPAQCAAAVRAFSQVNSIEMGVRDSLLSRRRKITSWLDGRPSWAAHHAEVGPFSWVVLPEPDDLTASIEAGVSRFGVLLAPGSFFGIRNAFRISWTASEESIQQAIPQLDLMFVARPNTRRSIVASKNSNVQR